MSGLDVAKEDKSSTHLLQNILGDGETKLVSVKKLATIVEDSPLEIFPNEDDKTDK